MTDDQRILDVAEQSVKIAGSFLRLMSFEDLQIFDKGIDDVVTTFDLESERIITNNIKMYFPEHQIRAEESSESAASEIKEGEIFWYVDPLDGTKAFTKGQFAFVSLSVAARDSKGLVAAAVYNPFTDMLYSASRTSLGLLNDNPIPPRREVPLSDARMLIDFSGRLPCGLRTILATADLTGKIGRIFRFDGSIAQHLALIAQGTLDGGVFWGSGRKGDYWDIAGALLLLEKMNVKVTNLMGEEIVPSSEIFDQLIIASPKLHEELLIWVEKLQQ